MNSSDMIEWEQQRDRMAAYRFAIENRALQINSLIREISHFAKDFGRLPIQAEGYLHNAKIILGYVMSELEKASAEPTTPDS